MNTKHRTLLAVVCASGLLLAISGVVRYNSPDRQMVRLMSMPLADLTSLAERPGADTLTLQCYLLAALSYQDREKTWHAAERAADTIPQGDTTASGARVLAITASLIAEFGDIPRAIPMVDRVKRVSPNEPYLLATSASIARRNGDLGTAYEQFRLAAEKDPARIDLWAEAGYCALAGRLDTEAAETLSRATKLANASPSPTNARIYAAFGEANSRLGRYDDAYKARVIAAKLEPGSIEYETLPAISLAIAARSAEEYRDAAAALTSLTAKQPRNYRLQATLAGLHARFGEEQLAAKLQKAYLNAVPGDRAGWLAYAEMCDRSGDRTSAQEAQNRFDVITRIEDDVFEAQKQTLIRPADGLAFLGLSKALHRAGKIDQAYSALMRASKLAPSNSEIAQLIQRIDASMNSSQRPQQPTGSQIR